MFLNVLAPGQQELFLQAARLIAEQDGQVDELETALIEALTAECGFEAEPPSISFDDLVSAVGGALDSDVTRRAFLLELAGVTVIDGEAHPAELGRLGTLSEALAVSREELDSFLEYAQRARQLAAEGQALLVTQQPAA